MKYVEEYSIFEMGKFRYSSEGFLNTKDAIVLYNLIKEMYDSKSSSIWLKTNPLDDYPIDIRIDSMVKHPGYNTETNVIVLRSSSFETAKFIDGKMTSKQANGINTLQHECTHAWQNLRTDLLDSVVFNSNQQSNLSLNVNLEKRGLGDSVIDDINYFMGNVELHANLQTLYRYFYKWLKDGNKERANDILRSGNLDEIFLTGAAYGWIKFIYMLYISPDKDIKEEHREKLFNGKLGDNVVDYFCLFKDNKSKEYKKIYRSFINTLYALTLDDETTDSDIVFVIDQDLANYINKHGRMDWYKDKIEIYGTKQQ